MSDQNAVLTWSPKDSARFNFDIYRGVAAEPDEKIISSEIAENRVDIAILRAPVANSGRLQRLRRFGFDPTHTGTLVYYSADLQKHRPQPLRNHDIEFDEATPDDAPGITALVTDTFANYRSHYHGNQLLPAPAILAGYAEWARDHIPPGSNRRVWVVRSGGKIAAFACCQFDTGGDTCEGVLYGVHPDHAGSGIYGDLIRYTQSWFKQQGFHSMRVSTQIGNFAVQKVWSREGFHLVQAYDTFHVNALLSDRYGNTETHPLHFTASQVEAFARSTGDTNPIHLDDNAANQAGFHARICHGLLPLAELSRIFGTQNPGPGTLFAGMRIAFLRPVYQETVHTLQIRRIELPGSGKHLIAMAALRDPSDRICLLAYSDLLHRKAADPAARHAS